MENGALFHLNARLLNWKSEKYKVCGKFTFRNLCSVLLVILDL